MVFRFQVYTSRFYHVITCNILKRNSYEEDLMENITIVGNSKILKENLHELSWFSNYTGKTKFAVFRFFRIELLQNYLKNCFIRSVL